MKVKVRSLSHVRHFVTPWTTRFLCPWDFQGKNTGVGCHFLLQIIIWLSNKGIQFTLEQYGFELQRSRWDSDFFFPIENTTSLDNPLLVEFMGAETEARILWPPDVKSQLIRKDPDVGKDWRQEEKGPAEDEMFGWNHHWLDGHEFEQALGVGDGQGSLMCYSPWGRKDGVSEQQRMGVDLCIWRLTISYNQVFDCAESWCT